MYRCIQLKSTSHSETQGISNLFIKSIKVQIEVTEKCVFAHISEVMKSTYHIQEL